MDMTPRVASWRAEQEVEQEVDMAIFLTIALLFMTSAPSYAKGNLSAGAQSIEIELGSDESDYHLEPKKISLETGKAYEFEFESQGFKEYRFVAPEFFANIWIRSVEVDDVSLAVSSLRSISIEESHEETEVEMVFVPIRPGLYPFVLKGLESRGMKGMIHVR